MKTFRCGLPLLCVLACYPSAATAQTAARGTVAAPTTKQPLDGAAKAAYDSAKLLIANGDFASALEKFQQAYDLSKAPEMLFDMALCEKNLMHYSKMQALLKRYSAEGGARLSTADHKAVDTALAAIQNLVATLKVTANVDGASVIVDGVPVGTTPLASPPTVDLGRRTITVQKPDFEPFVTTVDAAGGSEVPVAATLVPVQHVAHLVVSSDEKASISINGKVAAAGRYDGPLPAGTYDVGVSEPGKRPYAAQIELRDGEARTVQVTLESERHAAVWPWVVGGAVVVAGAVVGGYFLFRPGEQNAAAPTGGLATVQLSAFH
jgi:PEGA domain